MRLENSHLEESGSGVFFVGSKISGPPLIFEPTPAPDVAVVTAGL